MKRMVKPTALAACAIAICTAAPAQTLEARTGLWASAHQTLVNGNRMPNIFDLKKGLSQQEKDDIAGAMKRLGLPAGWSPALDCGTSKTYDVPAIVQKANADGQCKVDGLTPTASGASFKLNCGSTDAGTVSGTGDVKVTGGTESQIKVVMNGTVNGMPMKFEQTTVSKWVGPDCSNPPAGIDPKWMQRLSGR